MPAVVMGAMSRAAVNEQYVGNLADGDSKALITRQYSTTKEEAAAVDRIVGSPLTLYIGHGDFVRHAVYELLMVYEKAGFPDEFIPDVVAHFRNMREGAYRIRLRQEFQDTLLVYENSLNEGLNVGDFELIADTLETLEGYVERTPDEHWKHYLKRTILKSSTLKSAVDKLFEVAREDRKFQGRADRWLVWLEGIAE